jgi:hypothetical protein
MPICYLTETEKNMQRTVVKAASCRPDEGQGNAAGINSVSSNSSVASSRLVPLQVPERNWQRWLSAAISIALLIAIVSQFEHLGLARLRAAIPVSLTFWAAFGAYYLALPTSEWVIFRRLWNLPASGFAALLRKLVSNEVLMGYSGEVAFYSWARQRSCLTSAPFGAIKDVSVTSALAGNLVTLVMMIAAWPLLGELHIGVGPREIALSIGVMIVVSVIVALFNRRIFSLPGKDLRFIFGMHLLRLAATTTLSAVMWHSALPDVDLSLWVLLAAVHLLVTRLPFVPNKDLVFAGAALFLVGHDGQVAELIALIATMILTMHLLIGGVLAVADLIDTADA